MFLKTVFTILLAGAICWLTGKVSSAQFVRSGIEREKPAQAGMPVTESLLQDPCGPVSCYVALKSIDKLGGRDFKQIASELGWDNGRPVEFMRIFKYLKSTQGVKAKLIRSSPQQLKEIMAQGNSVVILATRRNSNDLNHAVCLTGTGSDHFNFVEYPSLNYSLSEADLVKNWDGEANVITRTSWGKFGVLAVAVVFSLGFFWIRR